MAPKALLVVAGLLLVALLLDPSVGSAAAATNHEQSLAKVAASEAKAAPAGAHAGDSKQVRRCRCCWWQRGLCYRYCCLNGQVIPAAHWSAEPERRN
ncbi:hypothetical protein Taro_029366 [Colocasia esculenta]|uniref:Uncharacterized protein n=1 Tax=Colocasia esculenta TaxID=4460 RepID=A0A843VNV1_COLES|nr:hypothetical protein [Colocasia esculenta]